MYQYINKESKTIACFEKRGLRMSPIRSRKTDFGHFKILQECSSTWYDFNFFRPCASGMKKKDIGYIKLCNEFRSEDLSTRHLVTSKLGEKKSRLTKCIKKA